MLHANDGGAERGVVLPFTVLLMLVLLMLMGLAIDYGYARQRDRNAQNNADAAGLAAALEMQDAANDGCVAAVPEATGACTDHDPRVVARDYLIRNGWDHNGSGTITSNEADVDWPPITGEYAGDPDCVEVVTYETADTLFGSLVGADTMSVSASAVACGGYNSSDAIPAVLALGACGQDTLNWSGNDNDVIGGMHSNDDVKLEGGGNDYSGGTVPGDDFGYIHTNPSPQSWPGSDILLGGNTYPSDYSQSPVVRTDPLAAVINISDFVPSGGWSGLDNYYDFSSTGDVDMAVLASVGLYDSSSKVLAAGIYFTGTGKMVINDQILSIGPGDDSDTIRGVTFVTTSDIIDWSADQGSPAKPTDPNPIYGYTSLSGLPGELANRTAGDPGLLAFTTYDADGGSPCGSNAEITYQGNYFNTEGIIYAPNGEARHSGNGNIHQPGAIVAEQVAWSGDSNIVDGNGTAPTVSEPNADLKS